MESKTSLRFELFWFALSVTALVLFVPIAVETIANPSAWKSGFIDVRAGEVEPPTWFTFGVNCLLVALTALVACLTALLLIRRFRNRGEREPSEGE